MRIAFYTLGCKVNQYETEILKERFAAEGFDIVDPEGPADVYVLNSCTVTAGGDKKTRQTLRRLKRRCPGSKAVLTGCVPQCWPEIADQLPEADVITGSADRGSLIGAVRDCLATGERIIRITPHRPGERFEEMHASSMDAHKTRAFMKIEDGCDRYCSYCIIPTARGPVRSKPLADLKTELTGLALSGYQEVVLAGINLSLYGRDLGARLPDAVALACTTDGIRRVRLGSVEPHLITKEDVYRMARWKDKLCPQFHLALQSGCTETLARMNRRYTTEQYREMADLFRELFPGAAITTDIIVGFPGETEEEFARTLDFVRELGLARVHVFPYSVRPGTAAASMPNQVEKQVKEQRAAALSAVAEECREAFCRAQLGQVQQVLFEAKEHPDFARGYTPNYTQVTVPTKENLRGQILPVQLTGLTESGCSGILLPTV